MMERERLRGPMMIVGIILIIGLAACEAPLDCDVGTQGVSASFSDPGQMRVLEQGIATPIPITIENAGVGVSEGIVRIGYTRDLINISPSRIEFSGLSGKAAWNRCQGQQERAVVTATPYPLPITVQSFDTDVTLNMCYKYETNFSTNVCVDPRHQGINVLEPNCVPEEKTFSGGQGGPVGIVRVGSPVYQDSDGGTVRIRFTLRNYGGGTIITHREPNNLEGSCSINDDTYENYIYARTFIDDERMDCTELNPGFERQPYADAAEEYPKTYLRADPERVETRDGMITLDTYTFVCTASGLGIERELDMQINTELAYYYREQRSDSVTVELRKI